MYGNFGGGYNGNVQPPAFNPFLPTQQQWLPQQLANFPE